MNRSDPQSRRPRRRKRSWPRTILLIVFILAVLEGHGSERQSGPDHDYEYRDVDYRVDVALLVNHLFSDLKCLRIKKISACRNYSAEVFVRARRRRILASTTQ